MSCFWHRERQQLCLKLIFTYFNSLFNTVLFQMDFLEDVEQNEGKLTEVGMKQENNHKFDEKKLFDTELKYEENHTC